jgi:hypothetical protein
MLSVLDIINRELETKTQHQILGITRSPDHWISWDDAQMIMRALTAAKEKKTVNATAEEKEKIIKYSLEVYSTYFMAAVDAGLIKIGRTRSMKKRMLTLSSQSPVPLKLVASVAYDANFEKRLHFYFKDLRSHGEWFKADEPLLEFLRKLKRDPKSAAEQVDAHWLAHNA